MRLEFLSPMSSEFLFCLEKDRSIYRSDSSSPLPILSRYISTSPTPLISRLSSRNHHLLALKISEFLSIRPDPILKHWARAKIARFRPLKTSSLELNGTSSSNVEAEDQICRAIVEKFEKQPAASYSEIARVAWKAGRIRLATKVSGIQRCSTSCWLFDVETSH